MRRFALGASLLLAPAAAFGAQALVVVSEPLSPAAHEALDGLRAEWGGELETASSGRPLPSGPHGVVVALGGRAAQRARRSAAPVVVALAPAYRGPAATLVAMIPPPERFMARLAALGVRRLLAVRGAPSDPEFARRAAEAGKPFGIAVEEQVLSASDGLAHMLRVAGPRADALWLAPDPETVTPETFAAAREFARARGIPFFAPAAGLVSEEVLGDLTVSFRDCGREAGRAAKELLAGRPVAKVVYPEGIDTIAGTAVSTAAR